MVERKRPTISVGIGMGGPWHDARVTTIPRVRLKKELERSLRAGHPWIYADALAVPRGLQTGSVVDVESLRGQVIARGLYDARSPIAVRVATRDPSETLDAAWVRARVDSALAARRGAVDFAENSAFRWLNGEGDFLPGVVVDVYGPVAVVRLDGDAVRAWRGWVVDAVVAAGRTLGVRHVYERARGERGEALHGGTPPVPVEIREAGARFWVDVVHGQKTGFFLDQRENRRRVRQFAAGRSVANIFGYTGGFSVQAALGGARQVVTVDTAAPALDGARANLTLNGLDPARHACEREDAFVWLERARAEGRRYGLVIVDPPSFAPSERAVKKALAAYRDLHARALAVVEPEGLLAAASCSTHVGLEAFLGTLADGAERARRRLRLLEVAGQPADHPSLPAFPEGRYLKFVIARAD
jgi:23S rRNA (cytosine1962-C5)-methyltransferase